MKIKIMILVLFLFPKDSFSGRIKNIKVDENKIHSIYLKPGNSTIIRLPNKPLRVVIGVPNYYKLEFISNTNDIAIKMLRKIETNLFIYTENKVYAFLLKIRAGKHNDIVILYNKNKPSINSKNQYKNRIKLILNEKIKITIKDIKKYNANIDIIDFHIKNTSKRKINLKTLKINIFDRKNNILPYKLALKEKNLDSKSTTKARIFLKTIKKKNLILKMRFSNIERKIVIPRKFL